MTSIIPIDGNELRLLFRERLNLLVDDVDEDLMTAGLVDSLSLVDLLFQIEQRYGITIDLDALDLDHFRSLTRMAAWINTQRSAKA